MDRVEVGRATTDGMVVDTRKGNAGVGMVSMGISVVCLMGACVHSLTLLMVALPLCNTFDMRTQPSELAWRDGAAGHAACGG